jgi:hypothetical protein
VLSDASTALLDVDVGMAGMVSGAPVQAGGSNDPLKGGKGTNWEVRVLPTTT